jgi:hypothetical protein
LREDGYPGTVVVKFHATDAAGGAVVRSGRLPCAVALCASPEIAVKVDAFVGLSEVGFIGQRVSRDVVGAAAKGEGGV